MRKQNSTFKTKFISEAGSELGNNDYFAFVELEKYGCYVIADGLNDLPDAKSARLAVQTIILAFQEHPSMKRGAVGSYLKKANAALAGADGRERLKASVTAVITDYASIRYGYAGNTRLRLYRDGAVKAKTQDTSMGTDMAREKELPEDVLARHEERNNLYAYLGQGRGFHPQVSPKIKLADGDVLALYTRGIWENIDAGELDDVLSEAKDEPQESLDLIEDLLLSKQPDKLENYTFAAVFIDKVFQDPNRKRRLKRIITASAALAGTVFTLSLLAGIWAYKRRADRDEMESRYIQTIEYIQDGNFVRAGEECEKALALAQKLRRKKETRDIGNYQKLIEAVKGADDIFASGEYKEAQGAYVAASERSRYADRVADEYIAQRLAVITDYLEVFDDMQLGDALAAQGEYDRAEEKYLRAKGLATKICFQEGRQDALDALDALYESRNKAEEADTQEAKAKAANETGAAKLSADGDKAFGEEDYDSASTYYAMALEKYQELEDEAHAQLIRDKIASCSRKSGENLEKEQKAEEYMLAAKVQEDMGDLLEAKKQYLFAKNIYQGLKKDEKVMEIEGLLELLEIGIQQEAEEKALESSQETDLGGQADGGKADPVLGRQMDEGEGNPVLGRQENGEGSPTSREEAEDLPETSSGAPVELGPGFQ